MKNHRKIAAVLGAGALLLAVAGTALAANATPVGHYASTGSDKSNEGEFWVAYLNEHFDASLEEGDCDTKLQGESLDAVNNGDGSADLGAAYGWVIVKQGSPNPNITYDNTIFKDVTSTQTVYADTNGNFVHDDGDSGGISHIIVCAPGEEESNPPSFEQSQVGETDTPSNPPSFEQSQAGETDIPSNPPSFEQSQLGETDAPTEPNTAAVGGNGTSAPASGAWLLVVALGVLLASIVVLSPARAKSPR